MSLRSSVLLLALSMVLVAGNARALVLFDETFARTTTGKDEQARTFNADAGAAVIVFTNGSGANFDQVRQGKVVLNGEVIFGKEDFRVNGSITKTVALAAGSNALVIELSGKSGGQMSVSVRQGADQPVLTFPPNTIFVSTLGADSDTCGIAKDSACRTIGHGLQRASQVVGPLVAVAGGFYAESISLVSGVNVLAGYDDDFSRRHIPSLRATLRGPGTTTATVLASGIGAPTTFEGFFVLGPTVITTPTQRAANSYGVLIRDSTSSLVIQNNVIVGGVGGIGEEGLQGSSGSDGNAGQAGENADRGPLTGGVGGGSPVGGPVVDGATGGMSVTTEYNTRNNSGGKGAGPAGGLGGGGGFNGKPIFNCSTVQLPSNGPFDAGNGLAGLDGANGSAGSGGNGGRLSSNSWVSAAGGSGTAGGTGSGGGGGGAGGGVAPDELLGCAALFGPSGGGGGSGAASGREGRGGSGGGAAFSIFVALTDSASRPIIGANQIYLGIGARGGNGGAGGFGGFGGAGGAAGNASRTPATGVAGRGGNGGKGGHGGGGGGGAGGMSVGIAANFEQPSYQTDNDIFTEGGMAGAGGIGGLSAANPGQDGQAGELAAVRWLTP